MDYVPTIATFIAASFLYGILGRLDPPLHIGVKLIVVFFAGWAFHYVTRKLVTRLSRK